MLSVILLNITIVSCKTTQEVSRLPPTPKRIEQSVPQDVYDYASIILYYESLVQQWEAWSVAVLEIVE